MVGSMLHAGSRRIEKYGKRPLFSVFNTYDTVGRRTQLQYPNGMTANYGYDTRGRLTDIHYKNAANATLERYTQTYDTASNITQVLDAVNAKWDYLYDDRYRLTQAERRDGTTLKHRYTYGYDGADNVASQAIYNATAGTTNSIAYTYNAGNELTQSVSSANGTTTYAYDSWGRLTTITQGAQSATLGWAYQDRLKSYTTTITGETSVNYTYSGDGHRTGVDNSIYGQGPKTWTYDTRWGVRSQNYTNTPANSAWYVLEPNGTVLAEAPATGVVTSMKYYFRDHLGSTRSTRREDTTKSVSFEYVPYGKVYASSGLGQLFTQDRFTGHEYDYETNMYWAPYRNYRPDMLRWISRDPLGMFDGPNVYGYVQGRPTSYGDSTGAFVNVGGFTPRNECECSAVATKAGKYWGNPITGFGCNKNANDPSKWVQDSPYKNFMRHCGSACEITAQASPTCSKTVGWLNENVRELWENYLVGSDMSDDLANNEVGRQAGNLA